MLGLLKEVAMKSWKIVVCLMSLLFFVMAGTACQQSGAAKSSEFRGAIIKDNTTGMLYLRSEGKRYEIESQQDLSAMIGKTITMKGAISQKEGKTIIAVESVKGES
jgi:hypothetical protein